MVLLLGAAVSNAQQVDFSGTWLLQKRTSISGNDYVNGMPDKIYITQKADSIIIRKQTVGQNGKDTLYTEAAAVGRTSLLMVSPERLRKISLQWAANGPEFTEIVQYENGSSQQVNRKITYTWKLSDEKTLTLDRLDENLVTGEVWSMEGIFRKRTL